jgi:hypothetical protein
MLDAVKERRRSRQARQRTLVELPRGKIVRRLFRCEALDGRTLLIGATSDDIAGLVDSASAWVFRRDAGAWAAEAQLRAANGTAGDFFGTSVALAEPVAPPARSAPRAGSRSAAASSTRPRAS